MFFSKNWDEEVKTDCINFLKDEMKNEIQDCETRGYIHSNFFKAMGKRGYFSSVGINLKEEFYLYATVLKELAKASGSLALSYHINYLSGYAITTYIKDSNRQNKYVQAIKQEGKICAFALTEPMHGSDLSSLDTKITSDKEGYVLSGIKKYIVNGVNADLYIVAGQKEDNIYTT
ncbi:MULTISPECIES: acyl-CoA dehydrogenase family protein, partial [unclassified Sporosarcina]|uniref:acyl-CoA dehydrogenase family protein n=1 Tax=unclassified Sporosarcina TaxID=2647733 RepID=UPI00203DB575